MINPLSNYYVVYEITALPDILFAELVEASEILDFKGFEIPPYLLGGLIEARISLYSKEGTLIEMSSKPLPAYPATIAAHCNVTPLRLINNMLQASNKLRGTDISSSESV